MRQRIYRLWIVSYFWQICKFEVLLFYRKLLSDVTLGNSWNSSDPWNHSNPAKINDIRQNSHFCDVEDLYLDNFGVRLIWQVIQRLLTNLFQNKTKILFLQIYGYFFKISSLQFYVRLIREGIKRMRPFFDKLNLINILQIFEVLFEDLFSTVLCRTH